MAADVTWVQLLERGTRRPLGDPQPMHHRRAAGLIARGRAIAVIPGDGAPTIDQEDNQPAQVPQPGVATVRELLAAVSDGILDADVVLQAELEREDPRSTIIDRLGS